MVKTICAWCGKEIVTYPCKIKPRNFCSRECLATFSRKDKNPDGYMKLKDYTNISAHMTALNHELNPGRMNFSTRAKLSQIHKNSGEGKTYPKSFGVHAHRTVAERMLNRKLKPGEVVHHIDGNKRNNNPNNLMVFESQAAHAKWHSEHKEVMPHDIQATCLPGTLYKQDNPD